MRRLPALVLVVLPLAACGDGMRDLAPSSPISPTPNPSMAPVTSLTIAGPDTVLTGSNVLFDATATLSSGLTIYHISGDWRTDSPAVATITGQRVLTGRGPGTTTVTVTYRDRSASVPLRVLPNTSQPSAASANVVITFKPNPVSGSPFSCSPAEKDAPSWSFLEVYNETHGVGFRQRLETVNRYAENGALIDSSSDASDYYFAPNSQFVELFDTCVSLGGASSGIFEEILDGVDDQGNQLTFVNRVQLLPVASRP